MFLSQACNHRCFILLCHEIDDDRVDKCKSSDGAQDTWSGSSMYNPTMFFVSFDDFGSEWALHDYATSPNICTQHNRYTQQATIRGKKGVVIKKKKSNNDVKKYYGKLPPGTAAK